jgi:CheY-like chemotaxis protein
MVEKKIHHSKRGDMDGITAAERICSVADIPIVFLTGFSQDPLLQRAKITAPYGYLKYCDTPHTERAEKLGIQSKPK